MDKPPWTSNVNCQGPECTRTASVNGPGELRPGWLMVTQPGVILQPGGKQVQGQKVAAKYFPFCGFTCLYNWVAARLPSKKGVN